MLGARRAERIEALAEELARRGGKALPVATDVTDAAQVQRLVDAAVEVYGRIDPMFGAEAPGRAADTAVTFESGARTAWHTHPLGQTLIVTFGSGRVQREGGPIKEIRPGDVVLFEPNERHWHGASSTTAMQHIASADPTE